jgi:hypothetical protein
LISRIDGKDQAIVCGRGSWKKQRGAWGKLTEQPLAASGAWTDDTTFVGKLCFYETPYIVAVTLKFSGDEVRLSSEQNVGFGNTREPPLVGKAR